MIIAIINHTHYHSRAYEIAKKYGWIDKTHQVKNAVIDDRTSDALSKALDGERALRVGGADISFFKHRSDKAVISYQVHEYGPCKNPFRRPKPEKVYEDTRVIDLTHPYVTYFLAFREADHVIDAYHRHKEEDAKIQKKLERGTTLPDVLIVDGNGKLHRYWAGKK